jgi:hypothetical protein
MWPVAWSQYRDWLLLGGDGQIGSGLWVNHDVFGAVLKNHIIEGVQRARRKI